MEERPSFISNILPSCLHTLALSMEVPSHFRKSFVRVKDVLETKSINDAVESVVFEGHVHNIGNHIVVLH